MFLRLLRTLTLALLASVLALGGVVSTASRASALETSSLGIAPIGEADNFHIAVLPGETTEREALVTNLTNDTRHVAVYSIDATVTAQGGFALGNRTDPPKGIGAWARLPMTELTLAPHTATTVPFTLAVPADAVPGDYSGGIVIESDPAGRVQDLGKSFAIQMNLIERIGVRIYLNIAGQAVRSMKLGQLTWERTNGGIRFQLPVTNNGNMRLVPHGELALDGLGMRSHLDMSHVETLLPGSTVTLTAIWSKPPLLADGTATATVAFDEGTPQQRSTQIRIVPLLLAGGVLIALAAILFVAWRFIHFLRKVRKALRIAGQHTDTTRRPDIGQPADYGVERR
jgi:hypothetical protein